MVVVGLSNLRYLNRWSGWDDSVVEGQICSTDGRQVVDYTGDGKPDFLWRNSSDGQTGLWQMDGYIPGPFVGLPTVGTEWRGGSGTRP